MSFYGHLETTGQALIAQFGKAATLVKFEEQGPAHDPEIVEVDYPVTLVEVGYSLTNRTDTLIQVGDRMGLISTDGEAPAFDDKLEIDGKRYSFVDLQPLTPGPTTLLWDYLVRA